MGEGTEKVQKSKRNIVGVDARLVPFKRDARVRRYSRSRCLLVCKHACCHATLDTSVICLRVCHCVTWRPPSAAPLPPLRHTPMTRLLVRLWPLMRVKRNHVIVQPCHYFLRPPVPHLFTVRPLYGTSSLSIRLSPLPHCCYRYLSRTRLPSSATSRGKGLSPAPA